VLRSAMSFQVARRRDRQDPGLQHLSVGETRHWRLPEVQSHIESVGNQITDLIAHDQLKPQVWMLFQKTGKFARKKQTGEKGIDVYT